MAEPTTPREQRSFEYHWSNVMERMCTIFLHVRQGSDRLDFAQWMLGIIKARRDPDQVVKECGGRSRITDLLEMAAAHCAKAAIDRASGESRSDALSWTYLADSQFFVGAALLARAHEQVLPDLEAATQRAATTSVRRKGGAVRNRGWKIIEDEAVRLVGKRGLAGERWSNEREMARSIELDLRPVLLREAPDSSETRYVQTISNRLKQRGAEIGKYLTRKRKS